MKELRSPWEIREEKGEREERLTNWFTIIFRLKFLGKQLKMGKVVSFTSQWSLREGKALFPVGQLVLFLSFQLTSPFHIFTLNFGLPFFIQQGDKGSQRKETDFWNSARFLTEIRCILVNGFSFSPAVSPVMGSAASFTFRSGFLNSGDPGSSGKCSHHLVRSN